MSPAALGIGTLSTLETLLLQSKLVVPLLVGISSVANFITAYEDLNKTETPIFYLYQNVFFVSNGNLFYFYLTFCLPIPDIYLSNRTTNGIYNHLRYYF